MARCARDFTYIDDIVAGVVACLDSPPPDDGAVKAGGSVAPHRLYNIGNNRSEELMRHDRAHRAGLRPQGGDRVLPMQPGDVPETYADISAIQRDLGFEPTTPIEIGVPKFVGWFKDYRPNAGKASSRG